MKRAIKKLEKIAAKLRRDNEAVIKAIDKAMDPKRIHKIVTAQVKALIRAQEGKSK